MLIGVSGSMPSNKLLILVIYYVVNYSRTISFSGNTDPNFKYDELIFFES
jgi:hypothetical protein